MRLLNILYASCAPWFPTGYGKQSKEIVRILKRLGHNVTYACQWGLQGGPMMWEDVLVLPMQNDIFANDLLPFHTARYKPDIVITLFDCHVYKPHVVQGFRWVPLTPIDHVDVPYIVRAPLKQAWQPIAYSKHGFEAMKRVDLDPLYVPHCVDDKVFYIQSDEEVKAARVRHGVPDDKDFIAVMVAGNNDWPARKAFPEVFDAWAEFHKDHPNAMLYCHTNPTPGARAQGMDLEASLTLRGLTDGSVRLPNPYDLVMGQLTDADLCDWYNIADVLLNPSWGEGFGLPIVEAQMCGTPVIVNDTTSMPELCFNGWITNTAQRVETVQGGFRYPPDIECIEHALRDAYDTQPRNRDPIVRHELRERALAYSPDNVMNNYWKPALDKMTERIDVGGELRMVQP